MWRSLIAIVPAILKLVDNFTNPAKRKTGYILSIEKKIDKLEKKSEQLKRTLEKVLTSSPKRHGEFDLTDVHDQLLNNKNKLIKLRAKRDNLLRD